MNQLILRHYTVTYPLTAIKLLGFFVDGVGSATQAEQRRQSHQQ